MRLMASVAGDSAGVICRHNLRKALRLSAVGFVAAGTHNSRVELRRLHRRWIVSVFGLCPVAGFARNNHMFALLFLLNYVGMAGLQTSWPAKATGRAAISGMASPR